MKAMTFLIIIAIGFLAWGFYSAAVAVPSQMRNAIAVSAESQVEPVFCPASGIYTPPAWCMCMTSAVSEKLYADWSIVSRATTGFFIGRVRLGRDIERHVASSEIDCEGFI